MKSFIEYCNAVGYDPDYRKSVNREDDMIEKEAEAIVTWARDLREEYSDLSDGVYDAVLEEVMSFYNPENPDMTIVEWYDATAYYMQHVTKFIKRMAPMLVPPL